MNTHEMNTSVNATIDSTNMAACCVVDGFRYKNPSDKILARIGDDVETNFADSYELEAVGINMVQLAKALRAKKLTGYRLGVWLDGGVDINVALSAMNYGVKSGDINEMLVRMGADYLNSALESFVDAKVDEAAFTSLEERVFSQLHLN